MKKKYLFFFLLLSSFSLAQTPAFISDSLDKYITRGLKDWDVPGLAVVIVKDGKTIVSKGYGVKDIKSKEPVNENTLFMIASNTKLFTGTALAMLEQNKLISLNDKVTKYFPEYKLNDKTYTELVTIKDLLTHRIGTKTFQGDFTFLNSSLTRQEVMNKMRLLKPSNVFRQDFGYCNSCYLTAGEVIPKVTGRAWEDFINDSIIKPLQMNNTYVLGTGMEKKANAAKPYTTSYSGTLKEVPYDNWNNLAPSASIVSSVNDLSHWLRFQLDSGKYAGKQIIPFKTLLKTRDVAIMLSSRKSAVNPTHFTGYGLGVFTTDFNGKAVYWHTGGADGFVSNVCFVPEENLGIAILTNNDNQNFFEVLRYQILDAYLKVPYSDRSKKQLASFNEEMKAQLDEIKAWRDRVKGEKPKLPLSAYAGNYSNDLYGDIKITAEDNRLKINFLTHPNLSALLDYMDKDEWLMEYNHIGYGIFSVKFDVEGNKVKSVTTPQNPFIEYDPYTFIKK